MVTDEQLDHFRVQGTKVRVVRDANEENDVVGFVVAWNEEVVLIRKANRRVVRLPRHYLYQPYDLPRPEQY